MARKRDSQLRRDIMAAIAKLTVASQKTPKMDAKIKDAVAEFRAQVKKYPGWHELLQMDSERSIYALLKPKKQKRRKG